MTKRCVLFSIMMIVAGLAVAQIQTQLGYAKTIGKPDKPGVALAGVEVRIEGNTNTVLSNEKGNFSFPINSKQFKLSRAKKNGYELADPDLLRQSYGFTYNTPFIIPFISTEELRRIKNAVEDQTRQKLEKKFAEQNAILENLKDRKKLNEEEFGKKLTELEKKYNDLDTLVQKLADRYARTDYDIIDSTRLQINQAIEQGDIEGAVQLIMSKGNIADRIKKIEEKENQGKILSQIGDQRIQEAQAEKNELATDLKQIAEFHRDQHHDDSAYIYMEQRYLLDTTSVAYLYDLVHNCSFPYHDFKEEERTERVNRHLGYFTKLRQHTSELSSLYVGDDSCAISGRIEYGLADFYKDIGQLQLAIVQYRKSYSLLRQTKNILAVTALTEIGRSYWDSDEYDDARSTFEEALSYLHEGDDDSFYLYYLNDVYNLIALTYEAQGNMNQAMQTYQMAERDIDNYSKQDKDFITTPFIFLIPLQGYLGLYFANERELKKSIGYYDKAIRNAIQRYEQSKKNNDVFPIISLYKQQFNVYRQQKNYKKMLQCAEGAVDYSNRYMQRMPSSKSRLLYAESLCLLADAHAYLGQTDFAQAELIECLKKGEFAGNVFKDRYAKLCANVYSSFATCFARQKQYEKSLHAIDKAISCSVEMQQICQRGFESLRESHKEEAIIVEQFIAAYQQAKNIDMPHPYQRKCEILQTFGRKAEVAEIEKLIATLPLANVSIVPLSSYKSQFLSNN